MRQQSDALRGENKHLKEENNDLAEKAEAQWELLVDELLKR